MLYLPCLPGCPGAFEGRKKETLEVISTRSMLAKPRGVSLCVDTAPPLVGCGIIHLEAVSLRIGYDGLLLNLHGDAEDSNFH